MNMQDKIVVVTGAAKGIGLAFAEGFSAAGAKVVLADLDRASADIEAARIGNGAIALDLDVTSSASCEAMAKAAQAHFGRIDILINNAGVRYIAPFLEHDDAMWERTISTNLTGVFLTSRAVVPYMLSQGRGKIVNVASVTGILALTKRVAYGAAKAGVIGLTHSMAYELSSRGIWVNAIAPGPTETPMNAQYFTDEKMVATFRKEIPLGNWGQAADHVRAAMFLASDDSDYICGAVLPVDGGWTTGKGY